MKSSIILLALLLGAVASVEGAIAPGFYSFKNLGFSNGSMYLGFTNRTCGDVGTGQTPLIRSKATGATELFTVWDISIVGIHSSGAELATIRTPVVANRRIRCPGEMAAVFPATCGSSTLDIVNLAQQQFRMVRVSGKTATYKLVTNFKTSGCSRFVVGTSDGKVLLSKSGDSIYAQWKLSSAKLGTAVPGKPRIITITRGSGADRTTATVAFTAPTSHGCSPLTNYTLVATPLGGGTSIKKSLAGTKTSTNLYNLVANIKYNISLSATNKCGTGGRTSFVETLAKSDGLIAAGYYGLCAVKIDSRIKCFNSSEAIVDGLAYPPPAKWGVGNDIVSIATAFDTSSAVARNGTMGVWGYNSYTDCTTGDTRCPPSDPEWKANIANVYGWFFTQCATSKSGKAKCWGTSSVTDAEFATLPNFVADSTGGLWGGYIGGVRVIRAVADAVCVLYLDGKLECAGNSAHFGGAGSALGIPDDWRVGVTDIGIGFAGICVVKIDGTMLCSSETEPNNPSSYATLPVPDGFENDIERVECGNVACCAKKRSGDFTCWGVMDIDGNINLAAPAIGGIPDYAPGITKYTYRCIDYVPPTRRRSLNGFYGCPRWPIITDVVDFSVGMSTNCVLHKDGFVFCWGAGQPESGTVAIANLQSTLSKTGFDYLY